MKKRIYYLDKSWKILFKDLNVSPQDVLKQANLLLDFLSRKLPGLTPEMYFQFWSALEVLIDSPSFPLVLAQAVTVESFSPPIFACFCSPNLKLALGHLAHYKDLVAPIQFVLDHDEHISSVSIKPLPELGPCPPSIIALEFAFLVQIARLATRESIKPQAVYCTYDLPGQSAYEAFLGVPIQKASFNQVVFSAKDAAIPFMSANEAIWEMFELELNLHLNALKQEDPLSQRVKACLSAVLAGGSCTVTEVARRLAMSSRSLQRQLKQEGTSFQEVLGSLRHELALHYLNKTDFSDLDIAFGCSSFSYKAVKQHRCLYRGNESPLSDHNFLSRLGAGEKPSNRLNRHDKPRLSA